MAAGRVQNEELGNYSLVQGGPSGQGQPYGTGRYLGKRFCKMFSEGSTVVLQLPSYPGTQGELSGNCLQNLLPK